MERLFAAEGAFLQERADPLRPLIAVEEDAEFGSRGRVGPAAHLAKVEVVPRIAEEVSRPRLRGDAQRRARRRLVRRRNGGVESQQAVAPIVGVGRDGEVRRRLPAKHSHARYRGGKLDE